jgi:hypothetical protein
MVVFFSGCFKLQDDGHRQTSSFFVKKSFYGSFLPPFFGSMQSFQIFESAESILGGMNVGGGGLARLSFFQVTGSV